MPRRKSPTYADVQKQIAQLQTQAAALRKQEVADVIGKIRAAIAHYGISAADLGLSTKSGKGSAAVAQPKGRKPGAKKKAGTVPVRYRDDKGNTWTGRGNRARWLVEALAQGKKLEDFLVK
jgi:DNA-binding protein H-NS